MNTRIAPLLLRRARTMTCSPSGHASIKAFANEANGDSRRCRLVFEGSRVRKPADPGLCVS